MRRNNFWNESQLRRLNKGAKSAEQIAHEATRAQLQDSISALQRQWAEQDAAEQTRTQSIEKIMITNETRAKVRQAVHDELKKRFWDYSRWEDGLAAVLARDGAKFSNVAALKIEMMNEHHSRPSPQAFAAEVAREQRASGLSYDLAFGVVLERHSGLHSRPELANEDLSDSKAAAVEFQKLIEAGWQSHPSFDRRSQPDYSWIFNSVARANPALMKRMHSPGQTPANLWRTADLDAKAPAPSEA